MRMIFGLMLCTAACTGEAPKPGADDTGGGGTDTGPVLTYAEREADCSGMDPADPAPLGGWAALTFAAFASLRLRASALLAWILFSCSWVSCIGCWTVGCTGD